MTNDEKYNNYKKRKILRYLTIIFSLLTIILEAFALFRVISFLWGLIPFCLLYIAKYYYATVGEEKTKKKKNKSKNKASKE